MFALDHLGLDHRRETARAAVQFKNPLDIGTDLGAGINHPRPKLHLLGKIVFLEPGVAFKNYPVDDRIFNHPDDQGVAAALHHHIGKKTGGEQGFQAGVNCLGVERISHIDGQVSGDCIGLNARVANHGNELNCAEIQFFLGGRGKRGRKQEKERQGKNRK